MPALLIKDYLQTQGLRLSGDDVRIAYLMSQTVMNMGQASVEHAMLWPENEDFKLAGYIEQNTANEALLKQMFMALDSVFSRNERSLSAAIYAHMPSENLSSQLIRLSYRGAPLETVLLADADSAQTHLACRTAQTGWLNIADDVGYWLSLNELQGERNHNSGSQLSIPICTQTGKVLGVVHVEYSEAHQADAVAQADWVGLALALVEPIKTLLGVNDSEDEQDV